MTWARPRCRHVPHGPAPAACAEVTPTCCRQARVDHRRVPPRSPRQQLHHPRPSPPQPRRTADRRSASTGRPPTPTSRTTGRTRTDERHSVTAAPTAACYHDRRRARPVGATREPPPRPHPADGTTPPHTVDGHPTSTGQTPQSTSRATPPAGNRWVPRSRRPVPAYVLPRPMASHTCGRPVRHPRHPPRPPHTTALPTATPPAGTGECHPPHHQRTHCCDRVNPAAEVMNPVRRAGRRPV